MSDAEQIKSILADLGVKARVRAWTGSMKGHVHVTLWPGLTWTPQMLSALGAVGFVGKYPGGFIDTGFHLDFIQKRSNPRRRPKNWSRKALGLPARFGYADDPDAVDFITGKTPVEMGIKMKKTRAARASGTKAKMARFYRDPDTIDMFAGAHRQNPQRRIRRRPNPPRPVGWGTGTKYRFSPMGIGNERQVRVFCTAALPSEFMPPPWVYGTTVGLMIGVPYDNGKAKAEKLARWLVAQPEWAWAEAMKNKKGGWYVAARAWDSIHQALSGVTPF